MTPQVDITLNEHGEAVVTVISTQHASLQHLKDLPFNVCRGDDFNMTPNEEQVLRNLYHDYADVLRILIWNFQQGCSCIKSKPGRGGGVFC
jgi:hypothetical protein